jgi:hypothetical protein
MMSFKGDGALIGAPRMHTATLVSESDRTAFLPRLAGKHAMPFEARAFDFAEHFLPGYLGGMWDFYEVGEDGLGFMVPPLTDAPGLPAGLHEIGVPSNGYTGRVSAEAAGIIITLFALNHTYHSIRGRSDDEEDFLADRYQALLDYACEHPEAAAIGGAID